MANQRKEHNAKKVNSVGCNLLTQTIWDYPHSFSGCWLPNLWNPTKFRENWNL